MAFEPLEISQLPLSSSLPSLPAVALEVLRICQDPQSDIGDLAEWLSRDPILATKVLQMANSAYYNRGNEVTSINRAAVMLGLRALKVLALGFSLVADLPSKGEAGGFDLQVFWHRSLVNAVAGRSIAESIRSTKTEEAFLCGLLSQIGKLGLAQAAPERYCVVVAQGHGWPSEEMEQEVLGCTSSAVGELLLGQWRVPPSIIHGATYALRQDDLPADAPREWRELATITGVAIHAGDVLFAEDGAASLQTVNEEAERAFGLHAETVAEILEGLHDGVLESAEAFKVELPANRSYQEILNEAHAQLMSVSMNAVIDLEQTASALAELAGENEILQVRALTDKLTELANRTALEDALTREVHQRFRSEVEEDSLGVLMIDIDKFKSVNDKYGHASGDEVLHSVASAMAAVTRKADLLARWGGEEFCVVMPHTTHAGITAAAERFRRAVEENPVTLASGLELHITVSVGAAATACVTELEAGKRLIETADAALYRAKENGRNRAEIAPRATKKRR